ncbi:hypothetical protein P4S72_19020 [Vibrio sp. PP-XX7]
MIDHVSTSWSMDEVLSVTSSNNVTVQNSIVAEALNNPHHDKGKHGYGSLIRSGPPAVKAIHFIVICTRTTTVATPALVQTKNQATMKRWISIS